MKALLASGSRGLLPLLLCACTLVAAGPVRAATIVIQNNNAPGVGFNDPTPRAPVGGNPGTTLGAQRLAVFQRAADIWGGILPSNVTITVAATFEPLTCTTSSAVLGSAGALQAFANFPGAIPGYWYGEAPGNKLFGANLDPSTPEIQARFNLNIDAGCFGPGLVWYYGFDGNEGTNIELLPVVLHEIGHGLGFQTFTSGSTGNYLGTPTQPMPTIFDRFLLDKISNLHWDANTPAQRVASAVSVNQLVWDGASADKFAAGFLGTPRLLVNSPGGIAGNYTAQIATFGARLTQAGVTGNVVLVTDAVAPVNDGCDPITNAAAIAGNIALIDRGICGFTLKCAAAQAAGAIGVIIANNVAAGLPGMGGTDPTITIPCIGISQADGNTIKANLAGGVNVTIGLNPATPLPGADAAGRVLMYAPSTFAGGSSVSHFDVTATPNVLMEPAINVSLHDDLDITPFAFEDIGWFQQTGLTLQTSPAKGTCGEKVTLTATVSPDGKAKGTVEFFDGLTSLGVAPIVNNSSASLSLTNLSVGMHSLTAAHTCFTCSLATVSPKVNFEVNSAPSTVSLASDVPASLCGGKVNFTATVSPANASGSVEFFDGLNSLGSAPVSNGTATLSVTSLSAGPHSITASYSGDACYAPSTSNKILQAVAPTPTATLLESEPNPSGCGDPVVFVAKVTPAPGGGEVNFFDGLTFIGSAFVSGGTASITVVDLSVGHHSITAVFKGIDCFLASTSNKVDQEVDLNASEVVLSSSMNPSTCGVKVVLTARVQRPSAPGLVLMSRMDASPPSGTVNFFDNGMSIGSSPVVDSVATLSVNLTPGSHSLTATYKGDSCWAPGSSGKLTQNVDPNNTTTQLTSSPNPSSCGEKVTITATVDPPAASGEVNFYDNLQPIGAAVLVNGVATLSVPGFAAGSHSLTAEYKGDSCYAGSLTDKVTQVVNAGATTITLTSDPNPSRCDDKVTLTATIVPATATGTVNFFDSTAAVGSAPVVNGVAKLSITMLSEGVHSYTAVYKGDSCDAPSTSDKHVHTHGCPTATLLSLFKAEPLSGAVELRWQFGDPSRFVQTWIERAPSAIGPWNSVSLDTRQDAGVTVATDRTAASGHDYWYRLLARPEVGAPLVFGPVMASAGNNVQRFELASIWPNPGRRDIHVDFAVAREVNVRLSIVDVQGRELAVLATGSYRPGRYQAVWTGEASGALAPVGLYFVRYQVPGHVMVQRLVLTR